MPYRTFADRAYLDKATAFLTACRGRDALAGMWDVGDLHWWWRDDLYGDPANQRFWEGGGETLGMILLSERYATFDYELLPGLEASPDAHALFSEGLAWLERFSFIAEAEKPSLYIRDSHETLQDLARAAGFFEGGGARLQAYQRLATRPAAVPLPDGFSVRPLAESDLIGGRPPVLPLSAHAFSRVRETPSYAPELHLVVVSHGGDVAAECICWWDEANGTAIFEPVEIAKAFARRGLAKGLVAKGLSLLAEREVRLVKVSYDKRRQAAGRLYASLGFKTAFERRLFVQR